MASQKGVNNEEVSDSVSLQWKAAGDYVFSPPTLLISTDDVGTNNSGTVCTGTSMIFFDIPIEDESSPLLSQDNGNKNETRMEAGLNANVVENKANESNGESVPVMQCGQCGECCSTRRKENLSLNENEWYLNQPPNMNGCPFKSLHHSGLPSEFLRYPSYHSTDQRSHHILAEMTDYSSGIFMKMQFIVNNIKDCLGIWAQLFLQNLNAIIVNADQATVRTVLSKDSFAILRELATFYVDETKCEMVFRYWCLFYNVFSRNLVPVLPSDLKEKLMAQLQKDFALAAQNLCRCKLDSQCASRCEPDGEHRMISNDVQVRITSVIMYYLLCKVGNHSESTLDIYKETPSKLNAERFIKGYLVHLYIKLFENSTKQQSPKELVLMELLTHVLVAFNNMPNEKNLFSSAIDVMLDMGYLSSAVKTKDILCKLLQKESDCFQNGSRSKLIFSDPEIHISFETVGLSGVLKCLNSFMCNVEYQILTRDEQASLLNNMIQLQTFLGESEVWTREYENTFLHCSHLHCTLERNLGIDKHGIALDTDCSDTSTEVTGLKSASNNCFRITDSPATSDTSQSKLQPTVPSFSLDENDDDVDEWMISTKNISKLRKIYAHELDISDLDLARRNRSFIYNWLSKTFDFILPCRRQCCSNENE